MLVVWSTDVLRCFYDYVSFCQQVQTQWVAGPVLERPLVEMSYISKIHDSGGNCLESQ